jgi:hypothetical protein
MPTGRCSVTDVVRTRSTPGQSALHAVLNGNVTVELIDRSVLPEAGFSQDASLSVHF